MAPSARRWSASSPSSPAASALLLFSTGYMANLGVAATFAADRGDLVLGDRLNHASLVDAGLLARTAHFERYAHGDAAAAAQPSPRTPPARRTPARCC
ncbi:MAG: hypothetical protein U1F11_08060 [Steroidobacteraceae bacterium]